jgi:uncharacterized membrane protein YcaP (DUF421 family)
MIKINKDVNDIEYVTIEDNGHFTVMLKSTYDAQQAEATKVVDEAAPE